MKRIILGIETSCDETALAIVECNGSLSALKFKVLKETVSSQVAIHRPFGGVVPNLAKREHLVNLPLLERKIFGADAPAEKLWNKIDAVAVTVGPGLEPALWAGITFAQELSKKHKKPLVGVNHLEGHLYSFLLPPRAKVKQPADALPAVALIVSGGHTLLLEVKNLKTWKRLGETRDDAVGEAFDKVARLLDLPYPGGPEISKLAKSGNSAAILFPQPMVHSKDHDFSFSGLKTSVLYYLKEHPRASKADVAASFEHAAVNVLVEKTMRAAAGSKARAVLLSGGVAANELLRKTLGVAAKRRGLPLLVSKPSYNTDNAVMIAAAGYMALLRKKKLPMKAMGQLMI